MRLLTSLLLFALAIQAEITVIHAGRIVDVENQKILQRQSIVIDGERIQSIRPTEGETLPPGAKILDLASATILPGLIDTHTHLLHEHDLRLGFDDTHLVGQVAKAGTVKRALFGVQSAREMLEAGFTSVRDLGNSGVNGDVALRDAIQAGWVPGPRMMASTRAISLVGGQFDRLPTEGQSLIGQEYVQISGVEEARKAVRQALFDGADCIKIIVDVGIRMMTGEEMRAIVDEVQQVRRRGFGKFPVAAHAIGDMAIRAAVEAGVDSIEHGYGVSDRTLELMATKKTFLVLTEESADDARTSLISEVSRLWELPQPSESQKTMWKKQTANRITQAFAKGVPVAFGSDAYSRRPGQTRGQASLSGLFAYTEAGVPAFQALQSIPVKAAALLGRQEEIGSVKAGMLADLIAVDGDPTVDIQSLKRIRFVMKGGKAIKERPVQ